MPIHMAGVDHYGIPVEDLDRSLDFYRRVFGVEPGQVIDYDGRGLDRELRLSGARARLAFITLGDAVRIELLEFQQSVSAEYQLRDCDIGATHICLEVHDIDAAVASLREADVDVYADPHLEEAPGPLQGQRWLFFKDPDGVSFELVQQPPRAADADERGADERVPSDA